MKKIIVLSWAILTCWILQGQELNVNVNVSVPRLQTTDPKVFENLETSVEEFMNNQKWTNDVFEEEERIDVEIFIIVSEEISPVQFSGEIQILSSRPIFGTADQTPLLNHRDKDFLFEYEQFQPLEYTENQFQNNLTTILSFYAFIILGMDYDSFSPFGGQPYYLEAQEIVNNVPPNAASTYKGWRSVDGNRNRYWIVENTLSNRMRPYRQALYDYHRQGLDVAHKDLATGRAIMATAIEQLGNAEKSYPRTMILQMFSNAKSDEIIEVFKGGSQQEKNSIVNTMQKIDPSNSSTYRNGIK